jgi:hypothetical protein
MKVLVKILKIVIPIAAIITAIYFFSGSESSERKHLLTYLDQNSVAYHTQSVNDVQFVFESIDKQKSYSNLGTNLADSSYLMQYFAMNDGIISWHSTRQKTLAKVYWIFVHDLYDPFEDSSLVAEKIDNIFEVKINNEKYFLTVSNTLVALSANSEVIQELAHFDFFDDGLSTLLRKGILKGNWGELKAYLKEITPVFSSVDFDARGYYLEYYRGEASVFYTMRFDNLQKPCIGSGKAEFNGSLPSSTVAVWQSNFDDNSCMLAKHLKGSEQKIWDLEERYQFKVSTIMDAWFDGSFRFLYCNFNGMHTQIGAVKLKEDAAPFASGSRFFVDYSNIKAGNEMLQKSFTIARVIPEGLAKIVFPSNNSSSSLFVTQFKSHLYFAQKREPLVLLLNELITGNTLSLFDQVVSAQNHFFLRFPNMINFGSNNIDLTPENNFLVQGKSILLKNELIVQGQIVFN